MSNYDHVAAIYDFAKDHGYKVQDFNTMERQNKRGRYNYVRVAFVVILFVIVAALFLV